MPREGGTQFDPVRGRLCLNNPIAITLATPPLSNRAFAYAHFNTDVTPETHYNFSAGMDFRAHARNPIFDHQAQNILL